jgi:hypothetical protein
MRDKYAADVLGGCAFQAGCLLLVIIVNLTIGVMCVDYTMGTAFGVTPPRWVAVVGGLFRGEAAIPIAAVCWLVKSAGVHTPFFAHSNTP